MRIPAIVMITLVAMLALATSASCAVVYVNLNSPNNGPGNDWDHAYRTVAAGLTASVSGGEVWVARGVYVQQITLKDGVALYGGFAGTETARDERDWATNVTVLDGNQAGNVVTSSSGVTLSARIDGFTIRNGKGYNNGGNRCGGGVYITNSSPTIVNNTITANTAWYGGGVYVTGSSSAPTIVNNTIRVNTATYGGGLWSGGAPTIANNSITENSASQGAGIGGCAAMIANNLVAENAASDKGGGIYLGAASFSQTLANNTITGNTANSGGGVYSDGVPTLILVNTIVAFNSSGVYASAASLTLSYNCVYGNTGYNYSAITDPTGTNGNISVDPKFASMNYGNRHIQPDSPCAGHGSNSYVASSALDMDGQARIQGGTVDIGADESDDTTWTAEPYAIVRVSPGGNDSNDGSSWDSAKRTVQAGIDSARLQGGEVWVKAGIYYERIRLASYAFLYGGFAGIELQRDQRDWKSNVTVLDGQRGGSVVTSNVGYRVSAIDGFVIRNGMGTSSACGGGISCYSYASPIIANNRITANGSDFGGAGIFCYYASPLIANNTITTNNSSTAGSAIHCQFSFPTIVNNTITANSVPSGGAVYVIGTGTGPTIENTIIASNSSGLKVVSGTATLRYNCVSGNTGYDYSGIVNPTGTNGNISADPRFASAAYGNWHIQPNSPCVGAGSNAYVNVSGDIDLQPRIQPMGGVVDIGADESDGTMWPAGPYVVIRVSPDGDDSHDGLTWDAAKRTVQAGLEAAHLQGGEVWVKGGTYRERILLHPFVNLYGGFAGSETQRDQRDWKSNETVLDGGYGGKVVTADEPLASGAIDGFSIIHGKSISSGGGVYCLSSSPTIANNRIALNSASSGAGIYISGGSPSIANNVIVMNTASFDGGGIYCTGSSALIVNNTIAANGALSNNGGGLCVYGASFAPTIANTIVAFNTSGVYVSGGLPVLQGNCVYGNAEYDYKGLTNHTGTNGNISANPKFAGTGFGNWHIQPDSPCIGAGNNSYVSGTTDVDDQPRIQPVGGIADIGADESDGTVWPVALPVIVRVSLDGSDSNDGSSWVSAMRTVQAGMDAACATGGDVWVKAGVYNERITLRLSVNLYGGFAGTETEKDQRDWNSNVTVLDGQKGGTVVTASALFDAIAVDGLTIQNGLRNASYGGGIYSAYCSLAISNCVIKNNGAQYGGGAYFRGGSPRLTKSVVTLNTVTGSTAWGGGIYCSSHSLATIEDCVISYNTAPTYCAAGIELTSSDAIVTNNRIEYNSAGWASAGIDTSDCSPTISNNIIRGNVVADDASVGGDQGGGAGLWTFAGSPRVTNNSFIDNRTGSKGGAIWIYRSNGTFANNIFAFNSSGIFGKSPFGTPTFKNNCFYGNTGYNYLGVPPGADDVLADPLLADWPNGDYHLTASSPCINTGWNGAPGMQPVDLDGEARINRGIVDIGADECWLVPGTLADARMAANGAKVSLDKTIVSADFPDSFYLESDQRISGIRIEEPAHSLGAGMRADVSGIVMTNTDGERYIDADTAVQSPAPNDTGWVSPLMFNNRTLGGVGTRAFQLVKNGDVWVRQLVDVSGLNNVGLLVTTFGKVVWTDTNCFYLSDGSMSDDFLTPDPINNQPPGVKVLMPAGATLPQVGSHVSVTGVSSCYKADSIVFRLLRVSKAEDVTAVAQ